MKILYSALLVALLATGGCSRGKSAEPSFAARAYAHLATRMTTGKAELQRMLAARKNVSSYHMTINLSLHPGSVMVTDIDVSCPDHERIVTRVQDKTFEVVRVGTDGYVKQDNDQWTRQEISPDAYPCGDKPGQPSPWAILNEGREMSTVLANLAGNASAPVTVESGAYKMIDGAACQEWVVSFQHPGTKEKAPAGMSYTVCLDSRDHLPHRIVMGTGGMVVTYSQWNQPFQINPPAPAKLAAVITKQH